MQGFTPNTNQSNITIDLKKSFELLTSYTVAVPEHILLSRADLHAINDRDPNIIKRITHHYHLQWKNTPVRITVLDVESSQNDNHSKTIIVQGDANLFNELDTLVQASEVLLTQAKQPSYSGWVHTFNPETGSKKQFVIASTNGGSDSLNDEEVSTITWDTRTQTVVSKKLSKNPKVALFKNDGIQILSTHADEQLPPRHVLHEIGQTASRISRKVFKPCKLQWEYVDGSLIWNNIEYSENIVPQSISKDTIRTKPHLHNDHIVISKGVTLCPGIVQGKKNDTILVTNSITLSDTQKILESSGVICYTPITDQNIIEFIKKHHIPCIVQSKPSFLEKDIILNATEGTVYSLKKINNNYSNSFKNHYKSTVFEWHRNPYYKQQTTSVADGAICSYDFLLQLAGKHPTFKIKKNQPEFELAIYNSLVQAERSLSVAAYLCSDLHEGALNTLEYSQPYQSIYADTQENPYFGMRGGLAILHDPDFFKTQITALARFSKKVQKEIPAIIPFIRTVPELVWVSRILEEINQTEKTNVPLYLSIDVPAQIHQLQYFLRPSVKGIIIHLSKLHAIAYGLDPENEVLLRHYSTDTSLLSQYVAQITSYLAAPLPVWVVLEHMNKPILEAVQKWGVQSIITKPTLVKAIQQELES